MEIVPLIIDDNDNLGVTIFLKLIIILLTDGSVGRVIGYRLDSRSSNPGRARLFFSTMSRPALGLIQPPIQWVPRAIYPGVK